MRCSSTASISAETSATWKCAEMPELPEAETIVRDLQRKVTGRTITGTKVVHPDILGTQLTPPRLSRVLKGKSIQRVERRAKKVVLRLTDELVLVISLG